MGVGALDVLFQDEEARVGELALLALVAEPLVLNADVVRQLLLCGGGKVAHVAPQLVDPLGWQSSSLGAAKLRLGPL